MKNIFTCAIIALAFTPHATNAKSDLVDELLVETMKDIDSSIREPFNLMTCESYLETMRAPNKTNSFLMVSAYIIGRTHNLPVGKSPNVAVIEACIEFPTKKVEQIIEGFAPKQ